MFKRKYILILLLLIVSICAISAASAADNATDSIAADDANAVDIVAADEAADEISTNSENDLEKAANETSDEGDKLSVSEEDSELTADQSNDKLSMIFANWYTIDLFDTTINSDKKEVIYCYIEPCLISGSIGYDFNFNVYDRNSKVVYTHHYQNTKTEKRDYPMTIAKNTLTPGIYVMAAENTYDGITMDVAYLFVKGTADITVSDYNSNYMSGAKMTATLTDKVTKKPLTSLNVGVVFTKGKTSVTKYYTPNSNGQISFVPPVGAGMWTVQFVPLEPFVSGSASKTITIKKSGVSVKAMKVKEYKGFKMKLKATVKSNGKNVNEGKVMFKINGKKYYAKVKNGVATKSIKLKKIKKYYYSAKFLGNDNLYKTGKSFSKAILKKRFSVKIYAPNPKLYAGQSKKYTVLVKTTTGKKVKNGWLKFQGRNGKYTKAKVKNGKVRVWATGTLSDVFVKMHGDDAIYKKSVTKKYKIKYVPGSHKYKAAKVKYKGTTKFRCDQCGRTTTHTGHGYWGPYFYHIYTIYVI
ncbi:MAG: hypothetical protein E7Z79_06135 [Methanobrevibacter thaueri]|jgi:hypothetical protein|uniref:Bacterial Ig-like domain (Group 1) n=1 Tax=Methanobrevibacter thaueri TaxID=190975 RepID=A0A8T3VF68_9EURY|nr:hypothetical protein [Methanobrevibacter thaueri]MBE6502005.1 hypothetical protein [Methanobrevibacter thaueri]